MNGNNTAEFESWLARKNHVPYAVTCHSGTQALEIIASYCASNLLDNNRRLTVLIPAMTYPASANAFVRTGWQVEIVDTDSYGIMGQKPQEYDAVCAIGLYGAALGSMESESAIGCLIEDGAQHWLSNNCRRQADHTAISFDPTKNFPNYGNGGAVITRDLYLAEYARNWISNGKATGHETVGSNSRMSEVDCAQMMVKTRYIDEWQQRRKQIAAHWWDRLADDTRVRCLIDYTNFDTHSFHKFVIDVDDRDLLQRKLSAQQIETKIHYQYPLHELSAYEGCKGPGLLSTASSLARRCLTLPLYPELTDLEVEYIIDSVLDCV